MIGTLVVSWPQALDVWCLAVYQREFRMLPETGALISPLTNTATIDVKPPDGVRYLSEGRLLWEVPIGARRLAFHVPNTPAQFAPPRRSLFSGGSLASRKIAPTCSVGPRPPIHARSRPGPNGCINLRSLRRGVFSAVTIQGYAQYSPARRHSALIQELRSIITLSNWIHSTEGILFFWIQIG